MTDPSAAAAKINDTLALAREAYRAATQALAEAESAARAAGVNPSTDAPIEELRVQRIRVVEADGTTRMIIGNADTMTILPLRGEGIDHPGRGRSAGILFCNDEGTEAGGMVYNGRTEDGKPQQSGYWTVDDYEQNEGFRFGATQDGDARMKWIEYADQPHFSIADYIEATEGKSGDELQAVHKEFYPGPELLNGNGLTRMRLSREFDGSVALSLRDASGVERIRLAVAADGSAEITGTDTTGSTHRIYGAGVPEPTEP